MQKMNYLWVMQNKLVLLSIYLIVSGMNIHAQALAFHDARGWAAETPGGRDGRILRVTNLNASGAGSFTAALAAEGARIIVFEVGGIIDLQGSRITIREPFLTIAGQTAPSPGITIIDGSVSVHTHDVIIRHIRIRPGAARHSKDWEPDGITTDAAWNVIIDHCSISWAVDENCSASGPQFDGSTADEWRANTSHSITMSNNIISEGLSQATHTKGEHSKGSLIHDNVTEVAILNNIYAHNVKRNPYFKGGARGVVLNNYIYNPEGSAIRYNLVESEWTGHPHETGQMAVIGNVLQYGPSTDNIVLLDVDNGDCEVFMEDNIALNYSGNNTNLYYGSDSKLTDTIPVWHDNLHPIPASNVRDYVIKNAGARPWDRDEIDIRIINEMLTISGGIIDFETERGGFPDLPETYRTFNEEEWDLNTMLKPAPTVDIISPEQSAQFHPDSAISVELVAYDMDGEISFTELYINGVSEGQDSTAPYQWALIGLNPGNYQLVAIAKDDSNLISYSDTIVVTVLNTSEITPETSPDQFDLAIVNYPNPFNPVTNFQYTLQSKSSVVLSVYTLTGQRVETLINKLQNAGTYTISWDASDRASGVYFYMIKTDKSHTLSKCLLMK